MTYRCPRCDSYRPREEMKEEADGIWYCRVKCKVYRDET